MYLIGAPHPHKVDAQQMLERCVARGQRLVTNAEVLQEIMHRYAAIGRLEWIPVAFDTLLGVVDEVFPVTLADAERAKDILAGAHGLSARGAIHVAIMQRRGIAEIMSFDHGFDAAPGIRRLSA